MVMSGHVQRELRWPAPPEQRLLHSQNSLIVAFERWIQVFTGLEQQNVSMEFYDFENTRSMPCRAPLPCTVSPVIGVVDVTRRPASFILSPRPRKPSCLLYDYTQQ